MEVNQTERAITLSQEQFINKILEQFSLSDCRPVLTPLDPKYQLTKADSTSDPILNPTLYQQMIVLLMYLVTCTHPDLAFSVSFLSQFSVHPVQRHYTALKRVFRYLQGTHQLKLVYPRNGKLELTGYSDASYANCLDTRRSYSGYTFFLGDSAISWISKKQQPVSTSTTEAEYMALSLAARQAIWYKHSFEQFKIKIPIRLLCDNQSAIQLAQNPVLHQRSKHIDIHYHFIREQLQCNEMTLEYISTNENIADIMTKGLTHELHRKFTQQLRCTV
jgi:hypothetical protein